MNIKKLQEEINKKKEIYPEEWLGRSLAYTPYQPREIKNTIKKINNFIPKDIMELNTDDFLEKAKDNENKISAFILDSIENITYIRRYTSVPLIYNYTIIDKYQILESLVYGTDCIVLKPEFLEQKTIKELSEFAYKIGLEVIFNINSKEDLTKSIFAKSDILMLEDSKLINLIPKGKILISRNIKEASIDTHII